uniref:Uncharacterized protein n=1 Tax=Chromera velia CCMP2878 TaxID=1169474 RepID=A0A0G4H9P4_9ALVE|eukprot:Cvel_25434.t1-p1 / transcript=Cvel_25434.t1 / gene=Cvel_25434 / organism=Chromera_velia_CCMP2878 / gene_product=Keratin-associated protein 10-5, putative / transcript_product=Keratin-associated protein 10-5, putative / location=Cvel_scaffold2881:3688-5325(-) / protein_length=342 / sequence_SO=supercontig / SO=protein_coding / is_pseudo=false
MKPGDLFSIEGDITKNETGSKEAGKIIKKATCATAKKEHTFNCAAAGLGRYNAMKMGHVPCPDNKVDSCTAEICCSPPTCVTAAPLANYYECSSNGYGPFDGNFGANILCPGGDPAGCTPAICCGPSSCASANPIYDCAALNRTAVALEALACPSNDPAMCTAEFCCGPATCESADGAGERENVGYDCESLGLVESELRDRIVCPDPFDPESCTPEICCRDVTTEDAVFIASDFCETFGFNTLPNVALCNPGLGALESGCCGDATCASSAGPDINNFVRVCDQICGNIDITADDDAQFVICPNRSDPFSCSGFDNQGNFQGPPSYFCCEIDFGINPAPGVDG